MGAKRTSRIARSRALTVILAVLLSVGLLGGCGVRNKGNELASNPEIGVPSTPVSSPAVLPAPDSSQTSPSTPVSSSVISGTTPSATPSQIEPAGPVPSGVSPGSRPEVAPDPGELVELTDLDDSFVIDMRYATEDNFTGQKIYSQARCFLVRGTAEKLIAANREFAQMGYRLKIWDAYRPPSAQRALWEAVPDPNYVANPEKGSIHTRGAAVDVTLVDAEGNELPMPTGFDDFSEKAAIDYDGCTEEQARNRELLAEVMVRHGFDRIKTEWWHFVDSQASSYPMLDIEFEDME